MCSDSKVITLLLLIDFLPFPVEHQFLGFIRAPTTYPSFFGSWTRAHSIARPGACCACGWK